MEEAPPPHLRQELVLAKYDADKKEFAGRFTHALPQVSPKL